MKRADEKRTFREEKKEKYKDSLKKGQKHNMSCCFHENVALDETISVEKNWRFCVFTSNVCFYTAGRWNSTSALNGLLRPKLVTASQPLSKPVSQ